MCQRNLFGFFWEENYVLHRPNRFGRREILTACFSLRSSGVVRSSIFVRNGGVVRNNGYACNNRCSVSKAPESSRNSDCTDSRGGGGKVRSFGGNIRPLADSRNNLSYGFTSL